MGSREVSDVLIIILYVTGTFLLLITAYLIYLRRYRRGTLEALNNVVFITSRYDKYHTKTQFLIDLPRPSHVLLMLVDATESPIKELFNADCEAGQFTLNFDPQEFENGTYFLSLKTTNANMLRKIVIEKKS